MCAFQAIAVAAQESAAPVAALPNPAFVQHQLSLQGGRLLRQTGDGYPLGYVPSPLDFSHLKNLAVTRVGKDLLGLALLLRSPPPGQTHGSQGSGLLRQLLGLRSHRLPRIKPPDR